MILKPGLKLIGAKTKIRQKLYDMFPVDYDIYVEPFLGTGGVLIGHEPATVEFAYDINPHVINYYKVLQEHPDEFWDTFCGWMRMPQNKRLDGKELFDHLKFSAVYSIDSIPRAVAFYIVTKTCMNGIWRLNKKGECNSSYCGTFQGRGFFTEEWFCQVVNRIQHVKFEVADYKAVLAPTSGSDIFAFIDPPYRACKTTYNGMSFSDDDHTKLRDLLAIADYKWMVTINDDEFTRDLYADYNIHAHDVNYSCSQTAAGRGKKPELIITNY